MDEARRLCRLLTAKSDLLRHDTIVENLIDTLNKVCFKQWLGIQGLFRDAKSDFISFLFRLIILIILLDVKDEDFIVHVSLVESLLQLPEADF